MHLRHTNSLTDVYESLQHTTVHLAAFDTRPAFYTSETQILLTMIEPISPEAYLAIASAARNTITRYKDNRHAKKSAKLANASSQNSSNETSLSSSSLDDLLAQEGLALNEDGYVQFCSDSPANPRAWSGARKVYDLMLIMFLNLFMSAMSNAGTPVASYAMETFGVSRVIGLLGFTTV